MVRPLNEIDRRFCFELISPTKSHVLQADSEKLYQEPTILKRSSSRSLFLKICIYKGKTQRSIFLFIKKFYTVLDKSR